MQFDANDAKKKLSELATFPDRKQHILPHCSSEKSLKGIVVNWACVEFA